jgi:hypothetical protein
MTCQVWPDKKGRGVVQWLEHIDSVAGSVLYFVVSGSYTLLTTPCSVAVVESIHMGT